MTVIVVEFVAGGDETRYSHIGAVATPKKFVDKTYIVFFAICPPPPNAFKPSNIFHTAT